MKKPFRNIRIEGDNLVTQRNIFTTPIKTPMSMTKAIKQVIDLRYGISKQNVLISDEAKELLINLGYNINKIENAEPWFDGKSAEEYFEDTTQPWFGLLTDEQIASLIYCSTPDCTNVVKNNGDLCIKCWNS